MREQGVRAFVSARTVGATEVIRFADFLAIVLLDDRLAVQNHETECAPTPVDNRILLPRERRGIARNHARTSLCGPAKVPSNGVPSWPLSVDIPATVAST